MFRHHLLNVLCVLAAVAAQTVLPAHAGDVPGKPAPGAIAQVLVPEGVYAVELNKLLLQAHTQDQAQAESQLSHIGVEPKNGWISDYPLTPDILGELDRKIGLASEQGKIHLPKAEALKQVAAIKTRLGFDLNSSAHNLQAPVATAPAAAAGNTIYSFTDNSGAKHYTDDFESIPKAFQAQARVVSSTPLNQAAFPSAPRPAAAQTPAIDPASVSAYYQNQGPPVVTYYAPPAEYYYLYSWVEYPFWSSQSYYPGYYVLNNFHRQLTYQHTPYYVSHHHQPNSGYAHTPGIDTQDKSRWYQDGNARNAAAIVNQQRALNPQAAAINNTGVFSPPPLIQTPPALSQPESYNPATGAANFNLPGQQVPVQKHEWGQQSYHFGQIPQAFGGAANTPGVAVQPELRQHEMQEHEQRQHGMHQFEPQTAQPIIQQQIPVNPPAFTQESAHFANPQPAFEQRSAFPGNQHQHEGGWGGEHRR